MKNCTWCDTKTPTKPMNGGNKIPFICSICGSKVGNMNQTELKHLLHKMEAELNEYKEALSIIADQKDLTGNWAVELAKNTLKKGVSIAEI